MYLSRTKVCDAVVTEDSDVAINGAKLLLKNIDFTGNICTALRAHSLWSPPHLGIIKKESVLFLLNKWKNPIVMHVRAMAECDYGKIAPGVGPATILSALSKMKVPKAGADGVIDFDLYLLVCNLNFETEEARVQALKNAVHILNCYEYTWVYDPKTQRDVRLSSVPPECPHEVRVTCSYKGTEFDFDALRRNPTCCGTELPHEEESCITVTCRVPSGGQESSQEEPSSHEEPCLMSPAVAHAMGFLPNSLEEKDCYPQPAVTTIRLKYRRGCKQLRPEQVPGAILTASIAQLTTWLPTNNQTEEDWVKSKYGGDEAACVSDCPVTNIQVQ